MIPAFEPDGNLPAGVHEASWQEVVDRLGTTAWRLRLVAGLLDALKALHIAGCDRVYVNGSFATAKGRPGDFDACWEIAGVDPGLLDPILLTFADGRAAQKARFLGELFPAESPADAAGTVFLAYFQRDRRTGRPKGIIAIDLGELP